MMFIAVYKFYIPIIRIHPLNWCVDRHKSTYVSALYLMSSGAISTQPTEDIVVNILERGSGRLILGGVSIVVV